MGLNRPLLSILRDVQAALDPSNTSVLATNWGSTEVQPCLPYKLQPNTSQGYGASWLGVTCSEILNADYLNTGTTAATKFLATLGGLSKLDLGNISLTGTIPVQLCELFPSVTLVDVSKNALVGSLPACFGQQGVVPSGTLIVPLSGRFMLSVFDNLVRAPPTCARRRAAPALPCLLVRLLSAMAPPKT